MAKTLFEKIEAIEKAADELLKQSAAKDVYIQKLRNQLLEINRLASNVASKSPTVTADAFIKYCLHSIEM